VKGVAQMMIKKYTAKNTMDPTSYLFSFISSLLFPRVRLETTLDSSGALDKFRVC
jgi:hypothetical protein